MDRLKKVVYRFLDEYVGDGVTAKPPTFQYNLYSQYDFTPKSAKNTYHLYSDNGTLILFFISHNGGEKLTLFRGRALCSTVSGYFNISDDESMIYVREWLADKYDIKKVSDLLKFIPVEEKVI